MAKKYLTEITQKIYGGRIMAGSDDALAPQENADAQNDILSIDDLIVSSTEGDTEEVNISDIQIEENTNQDVVRGMAKSGSSLSDILSKIPTIEHFVENTRNKVRAVEFRAEIEIIKSNLILAINQSNLDDTDKQKFIKALRACNVYEMCSKLANINAYFRKIKSELEKDGRADEFDVSRRDAQAFVASAPFFGVVELIKNRLK